MLIKFYKAILNLCLMKTFNNNLRPSIISLNCIFDDPIIRACNLIGISVILYFFSNKNILSQKKL